MVALLAVAAALLLVARWALTHADDPEAARFTGAAQCAGCHAAQHEAWRESQHAAAMQPALPATVLGRFDGARFTQGGVTSTFFRDGNRFLVNTVGPDGAPHDFGIAFTFGVWPLQQYLVAFPGGRLQPLSIAWDARPDTSGGQRWFSLDPEPDLEPSDDMHWTGRTLNWNYMCADCHATGVRKGYDAAADSFRTTMADTSVACEACHGPGSAHVTWARYPSWLRTLGWRSNGLPAQLTERRGVRWSIDSVTGNARPNAPRRGDREVDTCAPCHARRAHIADGYTAGAPLLDFYDPFPLVAGLYHPDGQQLDEVYDHASFLQSRMYAAGVTCSDCHDPHTQRLRRPGNEVCAQCHRSAKYDTTAHHGHPRASAGAACASCHMPVSTYLEVDDRHDHSIRVPRPDLTLTLGVPNACGRCHADRGAEWAARQVRSWTPGPPRSFQRFAHAFSTDDRRALGAVDSLAIVAGDSSQPAIVRASALARLGAHPGPVTRAAALAGARDGNALVRRAAASALEGLPPRDRVQAALPLLSDPTRAVRQQAAWLLAGVADSLPGPAARAAFDAAAAEFVASQRYNADRAENRVTLGTFFFERGDREAAAAEFRAALRLFPRFTQAYINLAGLMSLQGREDEAERTIRDGLVLQSGEPALHHALGLSLARAGRVTEALVPLARATQLSSHDPQFAHPYAVVLRSVGQAREAIRVLRAAQAAYPDRREVLLALAVFHRDLADSATARRYAGRLARAHPDDAQGRDLLRALQVRER